MSGTSGAAIQRLMREAPSPAQQAHAYLTGAVLRGNCFAAANQSGVTSQAGLSATTPVLTLYNPLNSGVYAVLLYAGAVFPVAFAAAADVWLAANLDTSKAAVTGTAAVAYNLLLGSSGASKCSPLLAATLPAAPVAIAQLGVGLTGAITTIPSRDPIGRWFNGGIILAPNTAISIQTSTASGSSGMLCEFVWEELTIDG